MTQENTAADSKLFITIKCLDGKVIDIRQNSCPSLNRDVIRIPSDVETEVLAPACSFNRFVVLGRVFLGTRPPHEGESGKIVSSVAFMPLVNEAALMNWVEESFAKYNGDLQAAVDAMPNWDGKLPIVQAWHEPVFTILSRHAHYMVGPWSWKGALHPSVAGKALNEIAAAYGIDRNTYHPPMVRIPGKEGKHQKYTYGSVFGWVEAQLKAKGEKPLITDPVFKNK